MRSFLIFTLFLSFVYAKELIAYYNKNCGCCESYFSKLEKEGFKVKRIQVDGDKLMEIKSQLKVPPNLRSCHTMLYKDRFVEGHVPPQGVKRAIEDKSIKGVASPHGIRSGRGGYEDRYFVVQKDVIKEVRP